MCKFVCPILIIVNGSARALKMLDSRTGVAGTSLGEPNGGMSTASMSGLAGTGMSNADGLGESRPSVDEFRLSVDERDGPCHCPGGAIACTARKASACHSYHTCFVFVRRQMETCSSELLGR